MVLAGVGCANLEAVREFAKTSAATADYKRIVTDYVQSPDRQVPLQPTENLQTLQDLLARRTEQQKQLLGAQEILASYLDALGDVAADELPNVDDEIDALGDSLDKAGFLGIGDEAAGKQTGKAAGQIAKIVIRVLIDHWRQRRVAELVASADPHLQTVVAGLRAVVTTDFAESFAQEEEAIHKTFDKSVVAASHASQSACCTDVGGAVAESVPSLARVLKAGRLDQLNTRREQLTAYDEILAKIAQGHADLAAHITNLTGDALKQRLKGYSKDIKSLYKAAAELLS